MTRISNIANAAFFKPFLTSAQRSAEVRALQRALSFYLSIYLYFYLSGYVCLQFVVYASLILDRLAFSCKQRFQFISIALDKATRDLSVYVLFTRAVNY